MFIKIVIILLLLIVAASLLAGRGSRHTPSSGRRSGTSVRTLMLRVAVILLALGALLATLHLAGN